MFSIFFQHYSHYSVLHRANYRKKVGWNLKKWLVYWSSCFHVLIKLVCGICFLCSKHCNDDKKRGNLQLFMVLRRLGWSKSIVTFYRKFLLKLTQEVMQIGHDDVCVCFFRFHLWAFREWSVFIYWRFGKDHWFRAPVCVLWRDWHRNVIWIAYWIFRWATKQQQHVYK